MKSDKSKPDQPRPGRVRSARIIAEQRRAEKRRRQLIQLGIGITVIVAVLGTTVAVLKSQETQAVAPPPNMNSSGGFELGAASAPVTVTVVEDFGCPFCGTFEAEVGTILDDYVASDQVKVQYRGIAFLDRAFSTDYSSRALNASACVAATSTSESWKSFHDALFEQQPAEGTAGLDDETLTSIATSAGSPSEVAECITDGTYRDWVKFQTKETLALDDVESTPTVFVNGDLVQAPSATTLRAAVEQASQP